MIDIEWTHNMDVFHFRTPLGFRVSGEWDDQVKATHWDAYDEHTDKEYSGSCPNQTPNRALCELIAAQVETMHKSKVGN